MTTLKQVTSSIGKIGSFAQPEIMASRGIIPYIANAIGRIGAGTASNLATNAPNINNIEELKKNAMERHFQ